MFTNLANYLLGTITNQQRHEDATGVQQEQTNLRLTSGDEDWVLVDRDSEGNSERSSRTSSECGGDDEEQRDLFIPRIRTRTSSTSSLPCATMEESWFLTPPPCFTSAGPVQLETSPLENLLIEHPSMSVYHHHPHHHHHQMLVMRRNNSAPVQVAEIVQQKEEDEVVVKAEEGAAGGEEMTVVEVRRGVTATAPRRGNNRTDILQKQERQCLISKKAQKAQIQKACQYLKKGYLERNNKAREVNNRNRRLRRGERSQGATRSYANNNRKC